MASASVCQQVETHSVVPCKFHYQIHHTIAKPHVQLEHLARFERHMRPWAYARGSMGESN